MWISKREYEELVDGLESANAMLARLESDAQHLAHQVTTLTHHNALLETKLENADQRAEDYRADLRDALRSISRETGGHSEGHMERFAADLARPVLSEEEREARREKREQLRSEGLFNRIDEVWGVGLSPDEMIRRREAAEAQLTKDTPDGG